MTQAATNPSAQANGITPPVVRAASLRLAPPFGGGWSRATGPVPRGFWGTTRLVPSSGHGLVQLGARSNDPNAPLTIGWYWDGWQCRIQIDRPTFWSARFFCEDLTVRPNGGQWVPRAFLTLRRLQGGPIFERSAVLSEGRTAFLAVAGVRPGTYELGIAFNVRSAYQGSARPVGELQARCTRVDQGLLLGAGPGEEPGRATAGSQDSEAEEIAAALIAYHQDAEMSEIESDQQAFELSQPS